MNALQQLQQEMSKVATTPEEYQQMLLAMQEADKFAKQSNVQQMQEGGFVQKQEQKGVGAYVPPPVQSFDTTPEKENVEMQVGGSVGNIALINAQKMADKQGGTPTGQYTGQNVGDISAEMIETPKLPTGAVITPTTTQQTAGQDIGVGVGQESGQVAIPTAMATTATAQGIEKTPAQQMQEQQVQGQVQQVTDATQAQQGAVTQTIAPQTLDKSSVSELQAAQGTATQMVNPVQRQIQAGELVAGVANAQTASQYTEQIQEATATPTKKATVAGQLEGLMQQFEGDNTPPWASGALRNVTAEMARRGLCASSLAGQAMVQAAM